MRASRERGCYLIATPLARRRSAAGVPGRLTPTAEAITGTGIMLLFTRPSAADERKMKSRDWLPLLPAAFIRDDMQGLIISSATEIQL